MKCKMSVTFEFPTRAPLTWRGEVEATSANTIASRAVRAAQRELKPRQYSSWVCVMLERLDAAPEGDEEGGEEDGESGATP
jgi:hypothetical protein